MKVDLFEQNSVVNLILFADVESDGLSDAGGLVLEKDTDIAAESRMREVSANSRLQLNDVAYTFEGVFRRLYRQRNVVVHGGSTASIGLEPALRIGGATIWSGHGPVVACPPDRGASAARTCCPRGEFARPSRRLGWSEGHQASRTAASGVISAATRTFAVVRDDARQLRTFVVDRTLHSRMNAILPAYEAALPAALPTSASGGRHD